MLLLNSVFNFKYIFSSFFPVFSKTIDFIFIIIIESLHFY